MSQNPTLSLCAQDQLSSPGESSVSCPPTLAPPQVATNGSFQGWAQAHSISFTLCQAAGQPVAKCQGVSLSSEMSGEGVYPRRLQGLGRQCVGVHKLSVSSRNLRDGVHLSKQGHTDTDRAVPLLWAGRLSAWGPTGYLPSTKAQRGSYRCP